MNIPPDLRTSQPASKDAELWQFFDRTYCINLMSRPDRRRSALAEFKRVGLEDRVHWMTVEKHPTDSEKGIYEAHMACLRAGLEAGAETILVFEDDVILPGFSADVLVRSAGFMRSDRRWSLFLLGGYIDRARKTGTPSVLHVKYRCSAHAYVVHRRFAQKLLEATWTGKAYDVVLRDMAGDQTYAAYPGFAFQSSSPTDNDKCRAIDRARRLIGGQRKLQRWNEFSTFYFWPLVLIHVIIILAMVLFAMVAHRGHWFRHEPLDFLLKRGGG